MHKTRITGWITIVAIALTLLLATGCNSGNTLELDAGDNGKAVELEVGQVLVITLDSNPTTGYSWEATGEHGELVQAGEPEYKQRNRDKQRVGAGGQETLRFEAKKAGQVRLELVYHRPWEKSAKPAGTFAVDVTIR
jgi:inhibitor of cysteine peptidase